MLRLKRITMRGFKSFADKITIPFESGFVSIAGPNGSGKSNIIDAISFVLGMTSAKQMRAQKLKNLIFNGGHKRKPAEYCEVSLYLNNEDKKIPDMPEEIKVSRKITKNGTSIYKLNSSTVPRRKIEEVLKVFGISSDGYNIIKQGDITKIIDMNPVQRRGIIDEISGIADFTEKKAKAEAELEKVTTRVNEMFLVIGEKEKLVERLKKERDAAKKYLDLSSELKIAKASLIKRQLEEETKKLEEVKKAIEEKDRAFKQYEQSFNEVDKQYEELEKELSKINNEILSKSRNLKIDLDMDKIRTEIIRTRDRIDYNNREIANINELMSRLSHGRDQNIIYSKLKEIEPGVYGTVYSLISTDPKYSVALEVGLGEHRNDIVVDTDGIALRLIRYLKQNKIGRARFIPLNKIRGQKKKNISGEGVIGPLIDLVEFDPKFEKAMEYVFGDTLVVDRIENARKIDGVRIVTLEGDLKERSGAMVGGYHKLRGRSSELANYSKRIKELEKKNESLEAHIKELEKKLAELEQSKSKESGIVVELEKKKKEIEEKMEKLKSGRKETFDLRLNIQTELNKLKISKARIEVSIDNLKLKMEEFKDVKKFMTLDREKLKNRIEVLVKEINALGPINLKAIDEFKTMNVEFFELKKKLEKLLEERDAIKKTADEIEQKRKAKFFSVFDQVRENFNKIYHDLTGGEGDLILEEPDNIDTGLIIQVQPKGKRVLSIDTISGGEKSVASLAFLFAVQQYSHSPFYIFDEIDAALDKENTLKITRMIKKYSKDFQFIVISHNDIMVSHADAVFGVSISDGVSKVFSIRLPRE